MTFTFDRSKHVFYSPEFEELIKDAIRFFNGTPIQPVPPIQPFEGAGVYALYYIGKNGIYKPFHEINRLEYRQPIYIGKAVPRGWRQGRATDSISSELYRRLCDHSKHQSCRKYRDFGFSVSFHDFRECCKQSDWNG